MIVMGHDHHAGVADHGLQRIATKILAHEFGDDGTLKNLDEYHRSSTACRIFLVRTYVYNDESLQSLSSAAVAIVDDVFRIE